MSDTTDVFVTSPEDLADATAVPDESPFPLDRSTAARELAGLFDLGEPVGRLAPSGPPAVPRRVEDDDDVTPGLISRLIDGVKVL
ncbi:MAG: hypothetical protein M3271_02090 [Actinomycetota bacterium]|nr:hypothetical protein [Actinomycetota bacterium]